MTSKKLYSAHLVNGALCEFGTGVREFKLLLQVGDFVLEFVLFVGVLVIVLDSVLVVEIDYLDRDGFSVLHFRLQLADLSLQITALGLELIGTLNDTFKITLDDL